VKILAVDPGSLACGVAFWLDGGGQVATVVTTTVFAPRNDTWRARLEVICDGLRRVAGDWRPDVVAIEETIAFRATLNVGFILARGYLIRFLTGELYPGVEMIEVPLSTVRRAVGVKGNAPRRIRQDATRALFPSATTQDAADAAAVAQAAAGMIAELRAQAG
jgi:crossover junction endodeoxyribonuclease RuvC